jgi:hypothetical protein
MAHARNAPSDSKRWLLCLGALRLCKELGLDNSEGNTASREGTAAHWVREISLDLGLDPYDFINAKIQVDDETFVCDDDMAGALQWGIDRIRQFSGQIFIEKRVNITPWVGLDEDGNEQLGTLDVGIVCEEVIVISDLKFGRYIPVQAIRNYQQVLYALGFYEQFARHLTAATKFLIIIDQPRNSAGGGEWEVTLDELRAIGEWIKERAAKTFDPDAPRTPSNDACAFCSAAMRFGACPEYESWIMDQLETDLDDLEDFIEFGTELRPPRVEVMTPSRLSALFQNRSIIKKFIERVEKHVVHEVQSGMGDIYGLKAIAGKRSKRVHVDEQRSTAWLKENGYTDDEIIINQLKTPAQLDKVCGKGNFPSELISGGEPTPTVVSIEDARPAMPLDAILIEEVNDLDDFE